MQSHHLTEEELIRQITNEPVATDRERALVDNLEEYIENEHESLTDVRNALNAAPDYDTVETQLRKVSGLLEDTPESNTDDPAWAALRAAFDALEAKSAAFEEHYTGLKADLGLALGDD